MQRDRTNLYVAYRKTFPHHLNPQRTKVRKYDRFDNLGQEEEGLIGTNEHGSVELDELQPLGQHDTRNDEYTKSIQSIENQGNDLVNRIRLNIKQLGRKYKDVLLPQFDDDIVKHEMNAVDEISNRITDELRMIYNLINELQKLDETLKMNDMAMFQDNSNHVTGARVLISNLKKRFAIMAQQFSGEFREMQGKYIRYLKKDEVEISNVNNGITALTNEDANDVESYSRKAMVESSKQIQLQNTQMQMQVNKNELIDDQQFLLEREREIYKISQSVVEISMIFKELENIVIDQGTILDNIEYNLDRTVENVQGAHQQLNKAEGYQKQTRKCKIVLFLVLLIFLMLMLLMVKPRRVDHYVHDKSPPAPTVEDAKTDEPAIGVTPPRRSFLL